MCLCSYECRFEIRIVLRIFTHVNILHMHFLWLPTIYLPISTYLSLPTYLYLPTSTYLSLLTYTYPPTFLYLSQCIYVRYSLPTYSRCINQLISNIFSETIGLQVVLIYLLWMDSQMLMMNKMSCAPFLQDKTSLYHSEHLFFLQLRF